MSEVEQPNQGAETQTGGAPVDEPQTETPEPQTDTEDADEPE